MINSLRDKYTFLNRYFWNDLYYSIKCWFNHRNKWALRAVPNEWRDLDFIFEEVLFAGIINFVEGEKCFDVVEWDTEEEKRIMEIYHWAKTGRCELDKEINNAYPKIKKPLTFPFEYEAGKDATYEELYGEVNRLEQLKETLDTQYLKWLIENRRTLWT